MAMRWTRGVLVLYACACLSLLLPGCGAGDAGLQPEAALVGTYAIRESGMLKEVVRIERKSDNYILRNKLRTLGWSKPKMALRPVTREDWQRITADNGDTAFVGLASDQIALFKVPPGWQREGFRTATGFFLFYSQGPGEAHKLR